jgi:hypothetical protein
MRNDKKILLLLVAVIVCLWLPMAQDNSFGGTADESNRKWHWFSALSLPNRWRLLGGTADVVIKDGKIRADLYDTNGFHGMTVNGHFENNKIRAEVIRHGTDDDLRRLSGMITEFEGRTSILLFESFAGGLVIGLTID